LLAKISSDAQKETGLKKFAPSKKITVLPKPLSLQAIYRFNFLHRRLALALLKRRCANHIMRGFCRRAWFEAHTKQPSRKKYEEN